MSKACSEVDYIRRKDFLKLFTFAPSEDEITEFLFGKERDFEVVYFDSGKAALFYVLSYFRHIDQIKNKNSELLVPQWVGSWVLNIAQKICFPTLELGDKTVGILCYHQYGYEQNMESILNLAHERNMFVIEDCAHALFSYCNDNNERCGLKGDAAIFSLSKFFPVPMGGGVISRNKEIVSYLKDKISIKNMFVSQFSFFTKAIMSSELGIANNKYVHELVEMSYAVYDRAPQVNKKVFKLLRDHISGDEITKRHLNTKYFYQHLGIENIPYINLEQNTSPYVIPYFIKSDCQGNLIVNELEKINIKTGIYHFDINQNMLSPEFIKVVWIPVHGDIDRCKERIVEIIKRFENEK